MKVKRIKKRDVDAFLNYLADNLGLSDKTITNHWMHRTLQFLDVGGGGTGRAADYAVRARLSCGRASCSPTRRKRCSGCSMRAARPPAHGTITIGCMCPAIAPPRGTGIWPSSLITCWIPAFGRRNWARCVCATMTGAGSSSSTGRAASSACCISARWRGGRSGVPLGRPGAALDAPLLSTAGQPMSAAPCSAITCSASQNGPASGANVHRFRHTFAINFLRNGGHLLASRIFSVRPR